MANFHSDESVFNFAVEYLKQISESLRMCSIYAVNEDIDNWCKWLRNAYRQLSIKLKDKKEDEDFVGNYNKKIDIQKLTDNIIEDEEANFKNIYFLMKPEYKYKHKKTILFLLDKLEIKIRRKLQERGMLLPSKADPRFAILER
jgi:hypothetical protein